MVSCIRKTGLLKYRVNPPNKEIMNPPIRERMEFFFYKINNTTAIIVAIIKGGIATLRLFPLL